MTGSYGSERTFQTISTVHYRDKTGHLLPVVVASATPFALENLQFEVTALRMINAQQRREIAELKARITEQAGGSTSTNCTP
jgi:hypothetical protein